MNTQIWSIQGAFAHKENYMTDYASPRDKEMISLNPDVFVLCTDVQENRSTTIKFNKKELLNHIDLDEMIPSVRYIRSVFECRVKTAKDIVDLLRNEDPLYSFRKGLYDSIQKGIDGGFTLPKYVIAEAEKVITYYKTKYMEYLERT